MDLNSIPKDILKRAKMIYINYPNNPTGQVATYELYKEIVDFARKNNILVVSDLAYGHLTYDGYKPLSILSIDGALDVCVEVHSMSKSFNMTGWRLAFVVGSEKFINLFASVKSNTDSGQFRAIQKAGVFALDNYHLVDINRGRYSRRLDLLTETLNEVGFKAIKPKAGFYIYVPIPKGVKKGIKFESAEDATLYILAKALVSTVPWDDCGSYLRFSVTYEADTIEEEGSVQLFVTRANVLTMNLDHLATKYDGQPESYYESFKKLMEINQYAKTLVQLRREAITYQRYLAYQSTGSIYNPEIINQQLQYLLEELNTAVIMLKQEE